MKAGLLGLVGVFAVLFPGGFLYRVNKRKGDAQAQLDIAKAEESATAAAGQAVEIMRGLLDEVVEAAERRNHESDRRLAAAEAKASTAIDRANQCELRERGLRDELAAVSARLAALESQLSDPAT